MPRIDPMKLLVCLSVLLAPNGGIRNAGEVRRLANLMAKFSKKLVSKAIYIQILKCTETELLGQFMQTGGWTLVHTWLVDGIASKNWPLIQELMELLLCCPVDVERLKINSTPRLVKSLSTDCAHESVKVLATKLVEQWLYIVKAPKQLSPMVPINQSDLPAVPGLAGITEGKQPNSEGTNSAIGGVLAKQGGESGHHYQQNGYAVHNTSNDVANIQQSEVGRDDVDSGKKTFQTGGGEAQQAVASSKKTSLVLKITTKNGKQVVAKVIKPNRKQQRAPLLGEEDDDLGEDEEEEDQEEVVVNIESGKSTDESVAVNEQNDQAGTDMKKIDVQNGIESSKERNTSSSKDKDRHHHSHREREKEKDRKGGSSSSSSGRSSSKSSGSSSNSSSKHKSSSSSSSKSSSSSSSRSKDKDRHSSSSSSSTNKHKSSSSSSSSKSNSSGSKSSSSSSDKHRDSKDKSSHSTSGSSSGTRDSKNQSQSFSSSKLSRKNSRDDGAGGSNDSGSESSSTTNTSANGAKTTKSASAAAIPNKKASISIEVRNPENRPKTVKTYNSQFRSHGLIEEAPPPPSRKGLKKPSSTSPSTASSNTSSTTIGSTATGTVKRSSPVSSGREAVLAGSPVEKKPREDPLERPGSIKLIPPKRQRKCSSRLTLLNWRSLFVLHFISAHSAVGG